jgi:hypothetical protein
MEPGQVLLNMSRDDLERRRKAIDDTTARILASFKKY